MKENLIINGNNAFATYGVVMGKGFIDAIEAGITLKDPIKNEVRTEHGTRMLVSTKKAERNVILAFNIHGATESLYRQKKAALEALFLAGKVSFQIVGRTEIYRMVYTGKSITYKHSYNGKFGVWTCQFTEPNPDNRGATDTNTNVRVIGS